MGDEDGRWRVAYTIQKEGRIGGSAGFLRSGIVAPGTLPTSASDWETFTSGGWKPAFAAVTGPHHEFDWPDIVSTLHVCGLGPHGTPEIQFTSMGGNVLASLCIDLEKECLSGLRAKVC